MHRDDKVAWKNMQRILRLERRALLNGHLEELVDVLQKKTNFLEDMNENDFSDVEAVSMLKDELKHNNLLLRGALRGIRSASWRILEVQSLCRNLTTYTAKGARVPAIVVYNKLLETRY